MDLEDGFGLVWTVHHRTGGVGVIERVSSGHSLGSNTQTITLSTTTRMMHCLQIRKISGYTLSHVNTVVNKVVLPDWYYFLNGFNCPVFSVQLELA